MFLGQALKNDLLKKVQAANSYGLLVDEVTDVAVLEQLISFIQFVNQQSGAPEVHFLSVQNVLETSTSANAETIVNVITEELKRDKLDINKLRSFASDGASVMTDSRNGVAAKLREQVPNLINIQCICHRLALACNDTNDTLKSISQWRLLFASFGAFSKIQQHDRQFMFKLPLK